MRRFGGVVAQYLGDGGATTREFESSHPRQAVGLYAPCRARKHFLRAQVTVAEKA
jgi:hypothetical protein